MRLIYALLILVVAFVLPTLFYALIFMLFLMLIISMEAFDVYAH